VQWAAIWIAGLPTYPLFTAWARTMTAAIADRDFLARRLRE
jgi:hypothetical protein